MVKIDGSHLGFFLFGSHLQNLKFMGPINSMGPLFALGPIGSHCAWVPSEQSTYSDKIGRHPVPTNKTVPYIPKHKGLNHDYF